jgi:hypothetical protein
MYIHFIPPPSLRKSFVAISNHFPSKNKKPCLTVMGRASITVVVSLCRKEIHYYMDVDYIVW